MREQRLFDVKKGAKVGFGELAEDFLEFYRDRGRRSLEHAETSVKHLQAHFAGKQSAEITPEAIEDYQNPAAGAVKAPEADEPSLHLSGTRGPQ